MDYFDYRCPECDHVTLGETFAHGGAQSHAFGCPHEPYFREREK
jgi:hypothetical protein